MLKLSSFRLTRSVHLARECQLGHDGRDSDHGALVDDLRLDRGIANLDQHLSFCTVHRVFATRSDALLPATPLINTTEPCLAPPRTLDRTGASDSGPSRIIHPLLTEYDSSTRVSPNGITSPVSFSIIDRINTQVVCHCKRQWLLHGAERHGQVDHALDLHLVPRETVQPTCVWPQWLGRPPLPLDHLLVDQTRDRARVDEHFRRHAAEETTRQGFNPIHTADHAIAFGDDPLVVLSISFDRSQPRFPPLRLQHSADHVDAMRPFLFVSLVSPLWRFLRHKHHVVNLKRHMFLRLGVLLGTNPGPLVPQTPRVQLLADGGRLKGVVLLRPVCQHTQPFLTHPLERSPEARTQPIRLVLERVFLISERRNLVLGPLVSVLHQVPQPAVHNLTYHRSAVGPPLLAEKTGRMRSPASLLRLQSV
ncbi:hypothetical protein ON010_g7259 [Phytophthora cinnamomi]|nr:hypothetical protein ON010_g7259 [Phytophthora cinnamomi]